MDLEPTYYVLYEFMVSIISLPTNSFALYCIVKKTPVEMKDYKIPLIYAQFFTMTLDLVLLAIKPELKFPAIAGRIFGIWDSVFGFGAKHALALGAFLVVSTLSSLTNVYFVKLQSLLEHPSFFKFNRLGKILYMFPLFVFYPLWLSGSIELAPIEQGTATKSFKELMLSHPTFAYFQNFSDIYVARFDALYPPYIQFSAIHVFCVGILIYGIYAIGQCWICIGGLDYVITNRCPNMSERTRKLQKKLFVALCIQHIIPTASLGVPWIYYAIVLFIQSDAIYQGVNNFFFGLLCSHGVLGSISLLILTEPYRRFTISLIMKTSILKYFGKHFLKKTNQHTVIPVSITGAF